MSERCRNAALWPPPNTRGTERGDAVCGVQLSISRLRHHLQWRHARTPPAGPTGSLILDHFLDEIPDLNLLPARLSDSRLPPLNLSEFRCKRTRGWRDYTGGVRSVTSNIPWCKQIWNLCLFCCEHLTCTLRDEMRKSSRIKPCQSGTSSANRRALDFDFYVFLISVLFWILFFPIYICHLIICTLHSVSMSLLQLRLQNRIWVNKKRWLKRNRYTSKWMLSIHVDSFFQLEP